MTYTTAVPTRKFIEYLHYNYIAEDGRLLRKRTCNQWVAGREVGTVGARGYKTIAVLGKRYYVHRIIYLMHHGTLPELIDHINMDKTDNRIENLRSLDKSGNALNMTKPHCDNKSGFLGVVYRKDTGKYSARLGNKSLGCFSTAIEAHEAYLAAKEEK